MNVCSKCGVKFADDKLACPMCGSPPLQNPTEEEKKPFIYESYESVGGRGNIDSGKSGLPWYLRWWVIVVCIFIFWPVAIVLFVLRLKFGSLKEGTSNINTAADRRQVMTGFKIGMGVILALMGLSAVKLLFTSTNGTDLIAALITIAVFWGLAAWVGLGGKSGVLMQKRQAKYEAVINKNGNTKISTIADKLGKNENTVLNELQKMLKKGFLQEPDKGMGAFINWEYKLLVMTRNGVPIVPVKETMAYEIAKANERIKKKQEQARRDSAKSEEDRFILAIEDTIAKGAPEAMKGVLQGIEGSIIRIDKLVKQEPEFAENKIVVNMKTKYIPSGIELLEKYQTSTISAESKKRIEDMFVTLAEAFANIEKQLLAHNDADTEIDIEILRQTLEREGMLDSDFDIKVN